MHQPVENGVGDGGVAQIVVPAFPWQLTGDDGGPRAIAILEDLEQIVSVAIGDGPESPVVEHQDVDAGEAPQDGDVGAVRVRERQIRKEARQRTIDHAVALATGLLPERTGQIRLADARWRR